MIRKLKSGQYRLYSRKIDPKTGRHRNLGTFNTREEAERHERAVQFFKRHRNCDGRKTFEEPDQEFFYFYDVMT